MRRRILSAFMAFALALTLLPTSAMALGSDQDPNQKALENGAEGNYVSFEFITSAPGEYHGVSLFGVNQSDTYPDSGKYFGSQLNGAAEKIYGALEEFFADSKNATTGTADFTIELDQETDSTFAEVADALAAFDRDHSEVFWTGLGGISTKGKTVSIEFPTSATWGAGAQRTIAGDQAAVETAVGELAKGATAASPNNRYVQLKYVHDWLVNNNKYGKANDSNLHYQWEAIGALDKAIDPVCEAYSRAFKLVCDRLSIPCVLVSGTAGGPHMWNYVQMEDSKWYLVDITWDDPVTEDGSGVLRYDYFLVGSANKGNREENTNFISVDNKYNDAFLYPTLSAEDYSEPNGPDRISFENAGGANPGESGIEAPAIQDDGNPGSIETQLYAVVVDGNGQPLADRKVTWSFGKVAYPEWASITSDGMLTITSGVFGSESGATELGSTYSCPVKAVASYGRIQENLEITVKGAPKVAELHVLKGNAPITTDEIMRGGTANYTAAATSQYGASISNLTSIIWTVAPETDGVTVTNGAVEVAGTVEKGATFTVTAASGEKTATVNVTVTDKPKHNLTGIPTEGVKLEFGTTDTVNVTSSTGGTVSWSSSDDATVSVANGMLTAKKVGAAAITVTASGGDTYADNVQTFTVTVTAKDLKDATVTINPEKFTYTGTAQTPDVVVTVGESPLDETDYTVSYENNTDVGTATLTIAGLANYTGTVTKTFEIKQAESKATEVQVTDPNLIYTTTDVSKVQLTGTVTLANDNSVEVTSSGTFAITAPEKFEEGKNTCTWTWTPNADTAKNVKSCTGTIEITATGRTVSSITVSALPTKTTYVYGEEFDPAGLVLDVTYNDSATPEKVTWSESSGITFSPESGLSEVGAKKVVVIYGEKTVDISVTVVPKTISLDRVHWTVPQTSISYDGKEHTGATLTGTIPAELTEKSRTGDKGTNAGTYTPSVTFELANGLTANNYTLPEDLTVKGTTWEIAAGTMTGKDIVRNVKYDTTEAQTVTAADFGITVSGVTAELGTMTPDTAIDVQQIETNSISFVPKSGLTAPDTPIEVKVPVTFKAANYEDCTVTLTVNVVSKNVPDLTVNDYTKTYDGKAVTMDDLADRLTAAFNDQTVSGSWAAVDSLPTDAGEYSCTLSFAPEDTETYVSGQTRVIKITINKANATVTANSYEIAIGEALPEYDYTVTGATKETLGCTPKLTCDATADSPAREYPITFSSKPEAKNYNITWVDGTLTIKAAVTPTAPAAPTASPASGTTFTDSVRVTLNAAEGAEIYYTLDGSEPTYVPVRAAGGTACRYSTPITLTETTTIKAIAVKDGRTSEVATFTYTKQPQTPVDPDPQPPVQQAATPVIEPAGGQFYTSVQVRITCTTPGATVYYALDGGTYNVYTAPFTLYGSTTVRAYATAPGMTDSNPASAYFSRYTAPVTPDPDPDPEPDDNYEPPASGTTGGSQSPTRPSTPTQPTKPTQPAQPETPAVPEVTTRPEAAVDGGTASAAVTPEAAEQLVEQAVSGRSDTLVIAPVIGGDVTKTEVKLPASAASAIAKETNAAVRVETPVANVTISNQGLAGLSSRGGEIAVTAEKTAGGVDVAVTVDGQRVENMPIKASVPTPCGPGTVAKIVDENGNVLSTVRKSSASADGQTMNLSLSGSAKVVFVEGSKTFTDIPADNWAAGAVAFASSHELMNGVSEQTFSPSQPMTRGMLAVVLHNLEGNPGASYKGGFSDVQVSAWYAEAVQWASEQKIVSGLSDGVFAPNSPITREQLVVMLYRYVGQPAASGSSLGRFSDAQNVSSWAAEAMNWAVSNGIVNGSNGALNPQGSATRAEVAQMLLNFVSSGVL